MRKKVVFLDLDGTLLTDDKIISEESIRVLRKALSAGHCIVITTGRSLAGATIITERFGLHVPGCFLLAFQGSLLYDCFREKIIMNNTIPSRRIIDLMKALEADGIYAHTYNANEILTTRMSPELERYNSITHERVRLISDYSELEHEKMTKVIAISYDNHEKLEAFQKKYRSREAGRFSSFFSAEEFLEYCRHDSNKGKGLEFLARYLRIPIADTIAVGDERNDISMISAAGVGVAMCSGRQEAKDAADYITEKDNNHDGAVEAIEKFVL